jgi:hypothetical protein
MSIIIVEGHREIAEVEFAGKHPDIFCTHLAAGLVESLAFYGETCRDFDLQEFRADINVQAAAKKDRPLGVTPIQLTIAGQLVFPEWLDLGQIARNEAITLLGKSGYLRDGDFSSSQLSLNLDGITTQSPHLNQTTNRNAFADSCVVYGHHLAAPYGLNGTFPSLILAKKIDEAVAALFKEEIPQLRPDGKVHVTTEYTKNGFNVRRAYVSASHAKNIDPDFRDTVRTGILRCVPELEGAEVLVNAGGNFDVYFLQADSGVSKAKDDVIITGGEHKLGTDRVWGKGLYKASSTLIPYVFALSKAVCGVTGAKYACVRAYAEYKQEQADLWLQDIDPAHERHRSAINSALGNLPRDRDSIRHITGMPVNLKSYRAFNDVNGFHEPDKPWKQDNLPLEQLLNRALG